MFERNILSSIKVVLDQAKGDRNNKISNVKSGLKHSPKRSRDRMAPSYEEAVNNHNVLPMQTFNSTENVHPLSKTKEIRTDVTSDLLKKILKSTAKAKQVDPTQELALHGTPESMNTNVVTSAKIKQLKTSCPSMKTLVLQNLNLHAKQKSRRARLADFPSNLESISLRSSTFEPKSFFAKMMSAKNGEVDKLRVLDVGRAIFVENGDCSAEIWPRLDSLQELYLEGAPHIDSTEFLERLLRNFPNLEVLDLEGTALNENDLVTIAKYAPNLKELYLGYTAVQNYSIIQMVNNRLSFPKLEVICLCETGVSDHGLDLLVRSCQSLRSITVKRSKVTENAVNAAKQILPGLQVHRVENTHIYAVFRDQGCDHFSANHNIVY